MENKLSENEKALFAAAVSLREQAGKRVVFPIINSTSLTELQKRVDILDIRPYRGRYAIGYFDAAILITPRKAAEGLELPPGYFSWSVDVSEIRGDKSGITIHMDVMAQDLLDVANRTVNSILHVVMSANQLLGFAGVMESDETEELTHPESEDDYGKSVVEMVKAAEIESTEIGVK